MLRAQNLSRSGAFIRKHHRLVTFMGALIVFITFVVKEGKQEQLKATVTSLELINAIYSLKQDTEIVNSRLTNLQREVGPGYDFIKTVVKGSRHDVMTLTLAIQRRSTITEMLQSALYWLNNVDEYLKTVPPNTHYGQKEEQTRRYLATLVEKQHELDTMLPYVDSPDYMSKALLKKVAILSGTLELESETCKGMALGLSSEVLEYARAARRGAEAEYKRYSYVSYALYTLGWGWVWLDDCMGTIRETVQSKVTIPDA